jgi:hypothetical protein
MPVTIQEIEIKVDLSENAGTKSPAEAANADSKADKEQIVAECVEEVLRILKERDER